MADDPQDKPDPKELWRNGKLPGATGVVRRPKRQKVKPLPDRKVREHLLALLGTYDPTGHGDPALGMRRLYDQDPDAKKVILKAMAHMFEAQVPDAVDDDQKEIELARAGARESAGVGGGNYNILLQGNPPMPGSGQPLPLPIESRQVEPQAEVEALPLEDGRLEELKEVEE